MALLVASTQAIRVNQEPIQLPEAQKNKMTELEKISDAEIQGLVNAAIKKNKEDSMRSQTGLKAKTRDEALLRDADLKALESVLARRIMDRLKAGGQYGNYHYPLSGDLAAKIHAIKAYHDVILNYELQNAIASNVDPVVSDILNRLRAITDYSHYNNGTYTRSNYTNYHYLQLEEQGVPVLMEPHYLLSNQALDMDLNQRDFIVEGVNGIGFMQLEEEGVPVLMEPHNLLSNQLESEDLRQRNYIIDGLDGYAFVQQNEMPDDQVVLQVHGVPVTVLGDDTVMRDTMGDYRFNNRMRVGLEDVNFSQNPVENPPFNNWSVHQPSPPHDHGMRGDEDLGQDIIVSGSQVHYAQHKK